MVVDKALIFTVFEMKSPNISFCFFQMSEGRRTQVVLLDDRRLDIVVQPRLFVSELLNIVASHCHLKDPDKQYFGLAFFDEKCKNMFFYFHFPANHSFSF